MDQALRLLIPTLYVAATTMAYALSNGTGSLHLFGGGDDSVYYLSAGEQLASGDTSVAVTNAYVYVVAFVLSHVGSAFTILALRLLNLVAAGLLFWAVQDLTKNADTAGVSTHTATYRSIRASIPFLLYPTLLYYTTTGLYRDIWIYALFVGAAAFALRLINRRIRPIPGSLVVASILVLLFLLRGYAAAAFVIGLALFAIHRASRSLLLPLLIVGVVGLAMLLFIPSVKIPILGRSLADIIAYRNDPATFGAGSSMGILLPANHPVNFVALYLASLLANAFGPFPWAIHSPYLAVVFLFESIPAMVTAVLLWRSRKSVSAGQAMLIWLAVVWLAFIALSNANYGTACRLRVPAWLILWVIATTKANAPTRSARCLATPDTLVHCHPPSSDSPGFTSERPN